MIASLRGLAALAVGAALAIALAIATRKTVEPAVDRALVPGFSTASKLQWGPLVVEKKAGHWVGFDDAAVDAIVATLRGARWHRRADAGRAGAIASTLVVDGRTIRIGQPLAGTEQQWLVVGDHAYLVDAWVARALSPAEWQLHDRQPFRAARGQLISFHAGKLENGRFSDGTEGYWIDPAPVRALEDALAALTVVGPAAAAPPTGPPIHVGAHAVEPIAVRSGTSGRTVGSDGIGTIECFAVLIDGRPACVEPSAWAAVTTAIAALEQPREALVDRRPAPIVVARIAFRDGEVELAKADRDAASELAVALYTPAELAGRSPDPFQHAGQLGLIDANNTRVDLDLVAPDRVVRDDGTILRVGTGAFAILSRPSTAYGDRTLWREDPVSITQIIVDGTTYDRGTVLGEWKQGGGPSTPNPTIDALVTALALPHAIGTSPKFTAKHAITIVTSEQRYALELGAKSPAGCPLRHAGREVLVDPATCF